MLVALLTFFCNAQNLVFVFLFLGCVVGMLERLRYTNGSIDFVATEWAVQFMLSYWDSLRLN